VVSSGHMKRLSSSSIDLTGVAAIITPPADKTMTVVTALRNFTCILFAASFCINSAAAQVLIPHGDYENDLENYLVAISHFFVLPHGAITEVANRFC
jgi:hypothetical protein